MEDLIWKAIGVGLIVAAIIVATNQDCLILYGTLCK